MWYLIPVGSLVIYYLWRTIRSTNDHMTKDSSIDAYIIDDSESSEDIIFKKSEEHYEINFEDLGRQILVMYGTEYGFSEELAKKLFDRILDVKPMSENEFPWQPRLVNARDYTYIDFTKEELCFFIISTSGDGVPPSEARKFYESMMQCIESLPNLQFCVLALGDSSYPHYCHTGRTLHNRLVELGAQALLECQDVDQEDWTVIGQWMDHVTSLLNTVTVIPALDYIEIESTENQAGYSRHKPYFASIVEKQLLTTVTKPGDKETIHVEIEVGDNLTWTAGDAVGIYPETDPAHVKVILSALGVSESFQIDTPTSAYKPCTEKVTLYDALMKYYDIKHVQPSLLQRIQEKYTSNSEKSDFLDRLLANGTSRENQELQEYLAEREIRDVMTEYSDAGLGVSEFLSTLRPLQPRYYSISSSPLISDTKLSVTAAVVRYETGGVSRSGVTTSHLSDRSTVGDKLPVFISQNHNFRLPSNHSSPLILIGPGTGIAPFRAFIQERSLSVKRGEITLYFGCRHKEKDFLYRKELERWSSCGIIKLRTAFSRDGDSKVYVQHLLQQDAQTIWRLLSQKNAYIYVCGDAKNMARDVHQTLLDIVKGEGHMTENDAQKYLLGLEKQEQYQKDVWVT